MSNVHEALPEWQKYAEFHAVLLVLNALTYDQSLSPSLYLFSRVIQLLTHMVRVLCWSFKLVCAFGSPSKNRPLSFRALFIPQMEPFESRPLLVPPIGCYSRAKIRNQATANRGSL